MSQESNYRKISNDIVSTAVKCGRDPAEITLIAVTKQVEWEIAKSLYEEGQRNFGENRVVDALLKQEEAPKDCQWHFIGNLQKNKIRKIVGKFALVHSIDSFELAEKLSAVSEESGIVTSILLQANTSGESSKQGLSPDEWKQCFEKIQQLKGVSVKGLMTMAPLINDEKIIRQCFKALRNLRDELSGVNEAKLHHLSMGMSSDFKIAIEEGATLVRIGTALFSPDSL